MSKITSASSGSSGAGNTPVSTGNGGSVAQVAGAVAAPVVAPKGFRSQLQTMLQGWQAVIPVESKAAMVAQMLATKALRSSTKKAKAPPVTVSLQPGATPAQSTAPAAITPAAVSPAGGMRQS